MSIIFRTLLVVVVVYSCSCAEKLEKIQSIKNVTKNKKIFYDYTKPRSQSIFGGYYAREGQFPWMVFLKEVQDWWNSKLCGGSIISSRWILTAGHCISPQSLKIFYAYFGGSYINPRYLGDHYFGRGTVMKVTDAIRHPKCTSYRQYDIGLLRTPEPIIFNEFTQPINLPNRHFQNASFIGRTVIASGWGNDGQDLSLHLKYTRLPIAPTSYCESYFELKLTNRHICTRIGNYYTDVCPGDSGGPIVLFINSRPIQIGINSFGGKNDSCPSYKPRIHTEISSYIDWITDETGLTF